MSGIRTNSLAAIALTAFFVVPVASGTVLITADAAYAKPGQGKAGERGKSADRGNSATASSTDQSPSSSAGSNGRGATARELKGMNSAHALANASPNAKPESQVGLVDAYRQEAIEAKAIYTDWQTAYKDYLGFQGSYSGPSSSELQAQIDELETQNGIIDDEIAKLDEASLTYDEDLAALEAQKVDVSALEAQKSQAIAYETELDRLTSESNRLAAEYDTAQQQEQDALDAATGGRELSDAALAELRSLLGL